MIVNWNGTNIHDFGLRAKDGTTHFVQLQPGMNKVAGWAAQDLKKSSIFQKYLDLGLVSVKAESEEDSTAENLSPGDVKFLTSLAVGEAKNHINDTVNLELLEEWLSVEKKEPVKAMLKKQIDSLKKPLKIEEKD